MENTKFLIFLQNVKGLGSSTLRVLIKRGAFKDNNFKDLKDVLSWLNKWGEYFPKQWPADKITLQDLEKANLVRQKIERDVKMCGAKAICYFDEEYSKRFKRMNDFPIVLYCLGDTSLLNSEKTIAVIGTRGANTQIGSVNLGVTESLVKNGYVTVSGFAKGHDLLCFDATNLYQGKHIAILPSGFNHIYPEEHKEIVPRALNRGHLFISEYPPASKPEKFTFVERDRLQTALSDGVVVMETSSNGGTMHAARATKKYHKPLFVFSPRYEIKECKLDGNKLLVEKWGGISFTGATEIIENLQKHQN